ncbi:hypothetical protein L218DRAFT_944864 [Marasmius fiardii PR-910]|nr:hypothetical protein L218DRAFT_944864 [Marasmius fiardii PR-910]
MAPTPVNDPVQAFVAVITPSLRLLIIGTAWAAALVPLLVLLFWMSTPAIRRQPIFIMNVLAVTMGIVIGIINIKLYATPMLSFTEPVPQRMYLALLGMLTIMPILMDCILAYRLTAVYPRQTTSKGLLAVVFIPIVTFKIARLTNITILLVILSHGMSPVVNVQQYWDHFQQLWDHTPYIKIDWFFQIFDNCYTSLLFLWQLWLGQFHERNIGRVDSYNFFLGGFILMSNIYLEIICILFATIWAVKTHAELADQKTQTAHSDLSFWAPTGTEASYRSSEEVLEVHVSQEVNIVVTPGSIELNDFHKASRKCEI